MYAEGDNLEFGSSINHLRERPERRYRQNTSRIILRRPNAAPREDSSEPGQGFDAIHCYCNTLQEEIASDVQYCFDLSPLTLAQLRGGQSHTIGKNNSNCSYCNNSLNNLLSRPRYFIYLFQPTTIPAIILFSLHSR